MVLRLKWILGDTGLPQNAVKGSQSTYRSFQAKDGETDVRPAALEILPLATISKEHRKKVRFACDRANGAKGDLL